MEMQTILICLSFYAVLFTPIYLFIRGASRCVYVSKEEWEQHFNEVNNDHNKTLVS